MIEVEFLSTEYRSNLAHAQPNTTPAHIAAADVQKKRDALAYQLAREYLRDLAPGVITNDLLDKYEKLSSIGPRRDSIPDIYHRLLDSIQNAGMRPAVIGGSIGGSDKLKSVLCGFEPSAILESYTDWQSVMERIQSDLQPKGQVRLERRSIWPLFCRAILSSAAFLSQFQSADDFYSWVDFFDSDERARVALPMLLDAEIEGLGFALACDFLKELGYTNFCKPDVHLRDIFVGLELCPEKASDLMLFKAIGRVARHVGKTPYAVDKAFWLVGSGFFYDDVNVGNRGRLPTSKKDFVEQASAELKSTMV